MNTDIPPALKSVTIIGAGPAGLIAAERLAMAGFAVTVHDRMPSVGRKLLMAGRGGLNLTHSEPIETFLARYGESAARLASLIAAFPPEALRQWSEALGEPTFVGSSGRVFPRSLKASPLLRAWLRRLDTVGVRFALRQDWRGFDAYGANVFALPDGEMTAVKSGATLLALGGASWPRLGSNGAWASILSDRGVAITPLRPANVGFRAAWSPMFRERFAGTPLKTITLGFEGQTIRGEALITQYGIEGGAIYALSAPLREAIARAGSARLVIDLCPQRSQAELAQRIAAQKPGQSLANLLRKAAALPPVAINLLRETAGQPLPRDADSLAGLIKAAPLVLTGIEGLERAISTAGGVSWDALDEHMMLKALPGVFVAGEMIDWEAPTGGYLLQASFATGVAAAEGIAAWLGAEMPATPR
ncbi:TIGR03862 family flavoprotein [Kaistia dalseonensis]|uniref:Flavoprotein (TIGR03862 family) n=1 Tax=Kaistia dalseonensis TaxID=410840 RepID=A0ABU0H5W3_9HYPH|nr:TIGR03862 family flavoprotein [Kaistia dalseonensis]MCX5495125.1 TIGR03862 family flavoprotein [Kaistia dalseonensis]MDQ0437707.1 putative flavoprotein (TIGR03862 family) [Kaistia dalseonensis]